MKYKIEIKKKAQKFIIKLPKPEQKIILEAIYNLPNGDIKPLKGHKGFYRLRVGDYRVIYTIDNGKYIIYVTRAGNRGDVYKNL